MKLQQLEYVLEIVKQGFHISGAASSLYTSQPSVSRQLQQFEEELGFAIFERSRNRIDGLTPAGEIVVDIAKRVMSDVGDLATLKDDLMSSNRGTLTIATTHTVATSSSAMTSSTSLARAKSAGVSSRNGARSSWYSGGRMSSLQRAPR